MRLPTPCTSLYRPRNPCATPLYQLVSRFYDEVKGRWEECFEQRYGYCRVGWETVCELITEATTADLQPGMVATVHTASSDLRWHPHDHAITSRGGWAPTGTWYPVLYADTHAAQLLFRQKVIWLLAARGLLSEDRIELLDS